MLSRILSCYSTIVILRATLSSEPVEKRWTLLGNGLTRRGRFRPPGGPGWFGVKLGPSCLPVKLVK